MTTPTEKKEAADLAAIAGSIIESVRERALETWDSNAKARDFIKERATRLAKLVFEMKMYAGDGPSKEELDGEIQIVKQSMENELAALALTGSAAAQSTFRAVAKTAFDVVRRLALGLL